MNAVAPSIYSYSFHISKLLLHTYWLVKYIHFNYCRTHSIIFLVLLDNIAVAISNMDSIDGVHVFAESIVDVICMRSSCFVWSFDRSGL